MKGIVRIANSYLELQRECEQLLAAFADHLIGLEQVVKEVELISKKYNTINNDAEVFPTGDKDFKKAKRHEALRSVPQSRRLKHQ